MVSALARKPLKSPPPGPTALIGFFQVTLMTTLQTLALSTGGAGKTTLLVYTFPFWIALLSVRWLDERLTRTGWIAIGVAAIGLGFVLYPLDLGHDLLSKGFALASALSWAVGAVITKRFRAKTHVELLPFTAWQLAYGAIPIVIIRARRTGQLRALHDTIFARAGVHRGPRNGARVLALVLHHRTPLGDRHRRRLAADTPS